MLQKTVTIKGLLRYKVMHQVEGIFSSTNDLTNKNRMGEVALPSNFCLLALGSCVATNIGQQMEKLGLDRITKGCLAYHSLSIGTDIGIRFHC